LRGALILKRSTMCRHVPAPPTGPVDLATLLPAALPGRPSRTLRRRTLRRTAPGQDSLFPATMGEAS
jgi:hypothetical protein